MLWLREKIASWFGRDWHRDVLDLGRLPPRHTVEVQTENGSFYLLTRTPDFEVLENGTVRGLFVEPFSSKFCSHMAEPKDTLVRREVVCRKSMWVRDLHRRGWRTTGLVRRWRYRTV